MMVARGVPGQNGAAPGVGDTAGAVLDRSKSCEFLGVLRSQANDMVDNEMRRRMTLSRPTRRAVLIGKGNRPESQRSGGLRRRPR
jgi:hypothetical protein